MCDEENNFRWNFKWLTTTKRPFNSHTTHHHQVNLLREVKKSISPSCLRFCLPDLPTWCFPRIAILILPLKFVILSFLIFFLYFLVAVFNIHSLSLSDFTLLIIYCNVSFVNIYQLSWHMHLLFFYKFNMFVEKNAIAILILSYGLIFH